MNIRIKTSKLLLNLERLKVIVNRKILPVFYWKTKEFILKTIFHLTFDRLNTFTFDQFIFLRTELFHLASKITLEFLLIETHQIFKILHSVKHSSPVKQFISYHLKSLRMQSEIHFKTKM